MAKTCPDLRSRHFDTAPLTPSPSLSISSIPPALAIRDHPSSSRVKISSSVASLLLLGKSGRLLRRGAGCGSWLDSGSTTTTVGASRAITGARAATGDTSSVEEGACCCDTSPGGGDSDRFDSFGKSRLLLGGRNDGDPGAFDITVDGTKIVRFVFTMTRNGRWWGLNNERVPVS
jgi:hypothetical protein